MAQNQGEQEDLCLVDVDCFKFRSRIPSLSSYLCNNVDVLEQLTERLYKQGIISNEERDEVLKTPSGDNEKALSLTKAIVATLTNSPKPLLATVIDELRKFDDLNDIIDTMTLPDVTDEGQYNYNNYTCVKMLSDRMSLR